jgi:hypothetical protein
MLNARSHCDRPPALASDGWGGGREALVGVYGHLPSKQPGPGRPPTRKQPGEEWQDLQMVKHRERGWVVGVEARVI